MPTMTFSDQDDTYVVNASSGTYTLSFLGGADHLTVKGGTFTTAHMGTGDDRVDLRTGDASIFGDAGNDRFDIYTGGIEADGGDDADRIIIHAGNNLRLAGGLGDDRFDLLANSFNLVSRGGDGNDLFYGNAHELSGTIYGDAGNDYFEGFANRNGNLIALYGGSGNDTYRVDAFTTPTLLEFAGEGIDKIQIARGQSFVLPDNIENLVVLESIAGGLGIDSTLAGNALNNNIIGGSNAETIFGFDGNDKLTAGGPYDAVYGGNGNDTLVGNGYSTLNGDAGNDILHGGGHDMLQGGAGNDTYYIGASGQDDIFEASTGGTDTIRIIEAPIYTEWTMPAGIEKAVQAVESTHFALHGNALSNVIAGSTGHDDLYGGAGNDRISGGPGGSYDTIYGQSGSDRLTGGGGDDWFVYESISDSPVGNIGVWADFISDFKGVFGAGGDELRLESIDANPAQDGDQDFQYTGTAGTGTSGDLWITTEADGYTHVWGDVNGDYMPDFEIVLNGTIYVDDITM